MTIVVLEMAGFLAYHRTGGLPGVFSL